MTLSTKLNVGCGGNPLEGYINLDKISYPHVDTLFDLEKIGRLDVGLEEKYLPFSEDSFDEIAMVHVVEHIINILPVMQELHRVARPGCRLTIACPYGSTDNADEDPTHVRRIFDNSFIYFSQAWYGENSYEYLGDWELETVMFRLRKEYFDGCNSSREIAFRIRTLRNVVDEFVAGLVAIKPRREPGFAPKTPKVQYKPV